MADPVPSLLRKTLRVSELTRYLKYLVEQDELLTALSVHGEISDFSRSPSGHIYFTLKDSTSQIACVLFRREALRQPEVVKDLRKGSSVVVHGFLTVYEPRGACQIFVERVLAHGEGALFKRVEQLKARLEEEGLFALERKRPLPPFPQILALVTSPGSQAYHDVLHRLRSQYPFARVIEVGVSVQGDGAADEMAMAIDIVNRLTDADVILLVRGGGAPEELAAFNEERLVRAIFASRVPVVTGVGHEMDVTLVDYVADRRAATPSLAAAVAVPDLLGLVGRITQLHAQSTHAMRQRLRLERNRWLEANRALIRASPQNRLRHQRQRADEYARGMDRAISLCLRTQRTRLNGLRAQLGALDPLAILQRGYAVISDVESGRVVSRLDAVRSGARVRARIADGEFLARVEES